MTRIAIIDYGSGNLRSVYNAVKRCEQIIKNIKTINVTDSQTIIDNSTHIILPGVGSFKSCLDGFHSKKNLYKSLYRNVFNLKKPFLGICVGMQMLCDRSLEGGNHQGFGWIAGSVERIEVNNNEYKIPHMGWNELVVDKKHPVIENITCKSKKNLNAYFVHSYACRLLNKEDQVLFTNYGQEFTSMVAKNNIVGTQFHPEKSHTFGLSFLESFIKWQG